MGDSLREREREVNEDRERRGEIEKDEQSCRHVIMINGFLCA